MPKVTPSKQVKAVKEETAIINPFAEPDELSDVVVKVKEHSLHMHSSILARFSPALKKMLKIGTSEERMKEIQLEEENAEDVIHMFCFFYNELTSCYTEGKDLTNIMSLCGKYEVPWLKERLEKLLLEKFYKTSDLTDQHRMYSLGFACQFSLEELKEKLLEKNFEGNFNDLEKLKGFEFLDKSSIAQILNARLYKSLKKPDSNEARSMFNVILKLAEERS